MQNHLQEIELITSKAGKTVPLQRAAFKQGFSFSHLDFKAQLKIWNSVWKNTTEFRTEMYCIYFLEEHVKDSEKMLLSWPKIKYWQDKISRWETSDGSLRCMPSWLSLMLS